MEYTAQRPNSRTKTAMAMMKMRMPVPMMFLLLSLLLPLFERKAREGLDVSKDEDSGSFPGNARQVGGFLCSFQFLEK
jgi:hypothetical protein